MQKQYRVMDNFDGTYGIEEYVSPGVWRVLQEVDSIDKAKVILKKMRGEDD